MTALVDERRRLGRTPPVPLLVKVAPDLAEAELEDAVGAITAAGVEGIVATNTTLGREGVRSPRGTEAGGLSGVPLRERSLGCVRAINRLTGGRLPIVAVGGIAGPEDAARAGRRCRAGPGLHRPGLPGSGARAGHLARAIRLSRARWNSGCHCEARRAEAISSPSQPHSGVPGMTGDCFVGLRPPRNDGALSLPAPEGPSDLHRLRNHAAACLA